MKYIKIVVELSEYTGLIVPVVFPNVLTHKAMADLTISQLEKQYPGKAIKTVSAGFTTLLDIEVSGRSESLNIDSEEDDKNLIMFNDYNAILDLPTEKRRPYERSEDHKNRIFRQGQKPVSVYECKIGQPSVVDFSRKPFEQPENWKRRINELIKRLRS